MPPARSSVPAPLPDCTPLFDAAAMREADRRAGEDHAIPRILLMERAGLASAEAALGAFPGTGAALVVVGAGNNGGDGMVVARHLAEAGWEVEVAAPGGRAPETPDGAAMAAIASSLGIGVGALDTDPAGRRAPRGGRAAGHRRPRGPAGRGGRRGGVDGRARRARC